MTWPVGVAVLRGAWRGSLPLVVAGCGPGGDATPWTARDSAGVAIVENRAPGPEPAWRVDTVALLDIGALEGEPEYQLFRVAQAIRLADGGIAVANGGTSEIRLYQANGRFVRALGRDGEGPGEFRAINSLWPVTAESLFVSDNSLNRVSVFDTAGRFVRAIPLRLAARSGSPSALLRAAGVWADGTLLVTTSTVFGSGEPIKDGASREESRYFRFSRHGELLDTLGTYPGFERFITSRANGFTVTGLPFGKVGVRVVCRDGYYYGSGDRFEIRWYDPRGALRRLIRREHQPLPVTTGDLERYRSRLLEAQRSDDDRRAVEQMLGDVPFPAEMPAHGPIVCDDAAYLWVQEYRRPGDESIRWSVFDPGGRLVGWVRTPDGLRVTHVGRDFVLGVWRDDLEVEHVRLHRLEREQS